MRIEIDSALQPDQALARLREQVGGDVPLVMLPSSHPRRPLRGSVDSGGFRVRLRTAYGNSFAAVSRGVIEPTPSGSRLRATVGMPAATVVGLAVYATAALFGGITALRGHNAHQVLSLIGVLSFCAFVVAVGRYLARREARQVVALLRTVLSLSPQSPPA